MSLNFYCDEEDNSHKELSLDKYNFLFIEYAKNSPTLPEALTQLYKEALSLEGNLIDKTINEILNSCKKRIDLGFVEIKKNFENITREDAYIICSYTYETDNTFLSPYKLLNRCLTVDDRKNGVRCVSKYFYLLLKSLRKLPKYYPKDKFLYRCINKLVNNSFYLKGNIKTFWGFTSTSYLPKLTYKFLNGEENTKAGTIFTLGGDVWGYDIGLFNYYHEKEILLEPERKYIIDNFLPPINRIINITCTVLKTNIVLNEIESLSNKISENKIEEENDSKESNSKDNNSKDNNSKENNSKDNNSKDNNSKDNNAKENDFVIKFEMEAKINDENTVISGIGVLCNIPSKKIKALITYNHMISLNLLNRVEKISLYIKRREKEVNLKINRYKYTNEDLDITIIEILDIDNIHNFIDIDKYMHSRNFIGTNIYSAYFKENGDFDLLDGKIIDKNNDNFICNIPSVKEGIILLKDNMKLMGIIKGNDNEIKILPINIITDKINYIKCIYEIKKEDVNKDIQIINNKDFYGNIKNIEIEKEVKVIINGEIKSNILTYQFDKEGNYDVYLISNNNLTNMSNMFRNCSSLKELDLSIFNFSQITNMSYIFYKCSSLKEINLLSSSTNQVKNMMFMFGNCSSLKQIYLTLLQTNQVTNMSYLFNNCTSLKELDLFSFNTTQVTNMSYMFNNCTSLEQVNLSSFNNNQATDMAGMFYNCSLLKKLNLSSFNTDKVNNMSYMFYNCSLLEEIQMDNFEISLVSNLSYMFYNCSSLKELNLSSFNTNQVTNMSSMFEGCSSLEKINLSSFNTRWVNNMSNMFKNCSSMKELNLSSFNTEKVKNMSSMFEGCSSLKDLNISTFIIKESTDMSNMFNLINKTIKIKVNDKRIKSLFKNPNDCIII